jgi:hypothetical protein
VKTRDASRRNVSTLGIGSVITVADVELIVLTLIFFGSCVWMVTGLNRLMGR